MSAALAKVASDDGRDPEGLVVAKSEEELDDPLRQGEPQRDRRHDLDPEFGEQDAETDARLKPRMRRLASSQARSWNAIRALL